ncbi:hypothetical protein GCM10027360_35950 [Amycolatopsis echigonensis]
MPPRAPKKYSVVLPMGRRAAAVCVIAEPSLSGMAGRSWSAAREVSAVLAGRMGVEGTRTAGLVQHCGTAESTAAQRLSPPRAGSVRSGSNFAVHSHTLVTGGQDAG